MQLSLANNNKKLPKPRSGSTSNCRFVRIMNSGYNNCNLIFYVNIADTGTITFIIALFVWVLNWLDLDNKKKVRINNGAKIQYKRINAISLSDWILFSLRSKISPCLYNILASTILQLVAINPWNSNHNCTRWNRCSPKNERVNRLLMGNLTPSSLYSLI